MFLSRLLRLFQQSWTDPRIIRLHCGVFDLDEQQDLDLDLDLDLDPQSVLLRSETTYVGAGTTQVSPVLLACSRGPAA